MSDSEVVGLLKEQGIAPSTAGAGSSESPDEKSPLVFLSMVEGADTVRIHVTAGGSGVTPAEGDKVVTVDAKRLPEVIDSIIQKLHLNQFLLVPVAQWRHLFDAVAFSLAENEEWQAVNTTATVELNTRDPLLCETVDFQTVSALMRALLTDGESLEQSIMLTTTSSPLLIEVIPDGVVRMSMGNQALADEVAEAIGI